jgi:glutathione synthase
METKELIERSRAIKCPCIQYMLANTKMVQKALCDEDVIRHYSRELEIDFIDDILASFAGMYDVNHKEALEEALLRENEYVLKPQREGGGNNLFGGEFVHLPVCSIQ